MLLFIGILLIKCLLIFKHLSKPFGANNRAQKKYPPYLLLFFFPFIFSLIIAYFLSPKARFNTIVMITNSSSQFKAILRHKNNHFGKSRLCLHTVKFILYILFYLFSSGKVKWLMWKVILLIEPNSSYATGLLQGVLEYSRINGPWTFYREPIAPFYRVRDWSSHIYRIKKWGANGIITRLPTAIRNITSLHLPIIATNDNQKYTHSPCVISNYQTTGEMAAKHLLERGFYNFAYCGFNMMFWSQERAKSYENLLKKNGYEVNFYKYPRTKSQQLWENESVLMIKWLKSLPKPVGIMACNDDRGQQVIEACRTAGLYVPEEVAVVGVDNDTILCGLSNPTLSSVNINTTRAGYEMAKLLENLMNGQKPDSQIIVAHPTHVVTRQSSETLATEDIIVSKAVHFIRQNAEKSIQVINIAQEVGTSRRTLLKRFQDTLGRTVMDELRRVRIERISQLLLETDLSISQIALKMDFTGIEHISRYFQQEKGMSPLTYRKKYSSSFYSKRLISQNSI